jgi:membrane protein
MKARDYLTSDIWERPREEFAGWGARGHGLVQFLGVSVKKFIGDDCQLRASALTYVTLIAIVPVLAVAFAVLKGLYLNEEQVNEHITRLQTFIPQISEGFANEAIERIREYVSNVDAGKLGAIGAVALFLTVVTALGSIEKSFNRIWSVKRPRSYLRRVADYIAVVVLAAVLLIPASAMNAAIQSVKAADRAQVSSEGGPPAPAESGEMDAGTEIRPRPPSNEESPGEPVESEQSTVDKVVSTLSGTFWTVVLRILPALCMFLLFSFLYFFFPNTRVRPTSAALGAISATVLWQLAQYAYIAFQIGMRRANVIYGALAQLPVLLAWVYLSWIIVLIGAEIASVHQLGLHNFILPRGREVPFAVWERAGLDILVRVCRAFRNGENPPDTGSLAKQLRAHQNLVEELLDTLSRLGYVCRVEEGHGGYVPGRELHQMKVHEVAQGLRRDSTRTYRAHVKASETVGRIIEAMQEGSRDAVSETTIADLLEGELQSGPALATETPHPKSTASVT